MVKIVKWEDIKDQFTDSLLLGNGASIAIDKCFSYDSLYEKASLTPEVEGLFESFNTKNFELVLQKLGEARKVMNALNIKCQKVLETHSSVQEALKTVLLKTHTDYDSFDFNADAITSFIMHFNHNIVSLNYDLTLYWARMKKDRNWSKDGFMKDGLFRQNFEPLRISPKSNKKHPLVFYPHGSLYLLRTYEGKAKKIKLSPNTKHNLLKEIFKNWASDKADPLIVCEGTSVEKMNVILNNTYLNTVYEKILPNIGKTLTVYGWSFSEHDQHIIDQISRSEVKKLAISVKKDDTTKAKAACEVLKAKILASFSKYGNKPKIYFFDSASPKCWNTP